MQEPLLDFLERQDAAGVTASAGAAASQALKPIEAKVRYAVLCYGVPLRIAEDPALREPGADNLPNALRRNGAAVDSELSPAALARPEPASWPGLAQSLLRRDQSPGFESDQRPADGRALGRAERRPSRGNWWTRRWRRKPTGFGAALILTCAA